MERQGWLEQIVKDAESMRSLKGFAENIVSEVEGNIELQVKVGRRVCTAKFIVCKEMSDELCILGQTVTCQFPYDYQWDTRIIVDRDRQIALPCYCKVGHVSTITSDFEPRIPPRKYTVIRPRRGTHVQLDISRLPVNGAYMLEAGEPTTKTIEVAVPRVLIYRKTISETSVWVPFLNFSASKIALRQNKYLMVTSYLGEWDQEADFIKKFPNHGEGWKNHA